MHENVGLQSFNHPAAASEALVDIATGADMPIAIIGMSCRFPGDADSPDKFWDLCSNGITAWSEIPKNRFNKDAFYHPTSEKNVTTNVKGGHFLKQDLGVFDAAFFNMTAEMASTMDPQLRILLESVFEAFENAGIPLEKIAGTRTSVFAAAFFRDYLDNIIRDPQAFPRYVMTGNGSTMMSNRISHFFDLRGPSMTIDTGCSTGLTILHQACQSLRTCESDISVIGGANILLNPDIFVLFSSLGFLSPDGRSHAFDSRAAGYGRGEGVSTIILKPLEQALKDGDPVRAVIRQTALSQDGRTQTITSPSQGAQEDLIRSCYKSARLSPADTIYVEAHGTGTPTGDPIEAAAIGKVFGEHRPVDKPLYIGSVKTNVGHMESVSGFSSILKVAMALEKGIIPPSINFDKPNPNIDFKNLKLQVPQRLEQWPAHSVKRASISNFGYGGSNAHVIMESLESWKASASRQTETTGLAQTTENDDDSKLVDWLTIKTKKNSTLGGRVELSVDSAYESASDSASDAQMPNTPKRNRVFLLSAKESGTARTMMRSLNNYLASFGGNDEEGFLDSLAYTLGDRRSRFSWPIAVAARTAKDLKQLLEDPKLKPSRISEQPRLGFVFTGQGAQWHGMGRELLNTYAVFKDSLRECDKYLKELGATWSLIDELTRDERSSRVYHVALSTPLCIAVQISLVRLLASWGIKPIAITSHSSGEVAAAFAAGAIDCRDAMAIVLARGPYLERLQEAKDGARGAMMAIGLSKEESERAISQLTRGRIGIAAVNSPSSVTVSGDIQAIEELEHNLANQKIFARKLKIAIAYHSHHMAPLEKDYLAVLRKTTRHEGEIGNVLYSSAVTGKRMLCTSRMTPEHWVRNMLGTVEFLDAFRAICFSDVPHAIGKKKEVDMVIEIGPHSALAGPIRQILLQPDLKDNNIAYGSCLIRGKDAIETMQDLACLLLNKGYPVDLNAVNFPGYSLFPKVLHDLPNYPWNHETSHWVESQLNQSHRFRKHPQHELLGSLMNGTNPFAPTWRHIIRSSEIPWVLDHLVQGDIVYPGAGLMVMAIEAIVQITDEVHELILGYELRDVDIKTALVIPETSEGVEVQLSLRPCIDKMLEKDWSEFLICSIAENNSCVEHCKGLVRVARMVKDDSTSWNDPASGSSVARHFQLEPAAYPVRVHPGELYGALQAVGINHGPTFKNLITLSTGINRSVATFSIADTAALMPGQREHGHVIHPTTLDSVIQSTYASLPGAGSREKSAMIPKSIKSLFVSKSISHDPGLLMESYSILKRHNQQGFATSVIVCRHEEAQAGPILEIDGLVCKALGMPGPTKELGESNTCLTMKWNSDLSLMDPGSLNDLLKVAPDPAFRFAEDKLRETVLCLISGALRTLTAKDVEEFSWYHKKYYEWMKTQEELALKHSTWRMPSKEARATLFEEVAEFIDGQMVLRIGNQLVKILRQQIAPLELMLEGQLLYEYYKGALRIDRSYAQVDQLIRLFRHKNPHANVLEIGGGTGGCTEYVLRGLGGGDTGDAARFAHYDFTDISAGFFEQAREKFAAWGDLVSFKTLDIEQEPYPQGFEEGSYDLIVACQVLHATISMKATMTHVSKLLKPGGKLILVETTNDVLDIQLIFGTLPNWWMSEEKERKTSPSLTVEMWDDVLQSTGFGGLEVAVQDCEDPRYVISVLMATAKPQNASALSESVVICYGGDTKPPAPWLDDLITSFQKLALLAPKVERLESVDAHGKVLIFLDDVEQSVLAQPTSAQFSSLQTSLLDARGIFWISSQATGDCQNPKAALSTGFLRTLRAEDTTKRYITLDIANEVLWTASAVKSIVKTYITAFDYSRDTSSLDSEFAVSGEIIKVPRLYDALAETQYMTTEASDFEAALQPFHQSGHDLRMHVRTPGMIDSLCWYDDPQARLPLPNGWVEIEPRAFGLNFRDVMVAMGQLDTDTMGFECSGIITRIGADVPQTFPVGSRVCCAMFGHWGNHVRVPWTNVGRIPDEMAFEIGASIPIAFITAYHSLFDLACLKKGETILIHSATGGVGQAAIMLAQNIGAEIFATVGSKEKREFLHTNYGLPYDHIYSSRNASFATKVMAMTKDNGVDVVLNSLAGPLLQATWNSIARFGRFLEIGKRDLEASNFLEMSPFTRNVSFFAIDLMQIQQFRGQVVARALEEVLRMVNEGTVYPIAPITLYPVSDLEKALRSMQAGKHLGKIVITPRDGDLVKVPTHRNARLSADASYLIVGGLGGIGQSIAQRLAKRGARNLILASRTAQSPRNSEFLERLAAQGCKSVAKNCDICDESDVVRMMKECASVMPPIKGIIQAAMVLRDSIFENLTFEDYNAAVGPKVFGTWNLHQQSLSLNLDFFIMLSSVTGIFGNHSQCNYAAGNTFEDGVARHRTAQGLPGLSLDLGPIRSVGYVSETAGVAERLKRAGTTMLEEEEMLRLIEYGIVMPNSACVDSCQIITGISRGSGKNWDSATFRENAIFSTLRMAHGSSAEGRQSTTSAKFDLKTQLQEVSSLAAAIDLIGAAIIKKLADMFAIGEDTIEAVAPLSQFGVDSLVAVELRNWLSSTTQAETSIFDVTQSSSIAGLAAKVAKKSKYIAVKAALET